ncbi:MAG: heavy metal-responsive transcriptional regulator [Gemmatimonadales bacterium]
MRIGEVARKAGVNVQTLRYYERRGLVLPARRESSGYREYDAETPRRVRFIKRAQRLGFSLADAAELLTLRGRPSSDMQAVRAAVTAQIDAIDSRVRSLSRIRAELAAMLECCEQTCDAPSLRCPIVEALDGPESDSLTVETPC